MHLAPMHLRSGRYPHEKEILFPPLVGLEAIDKRTEGKTLVVELRLSLNLQAQTLEQVNAKRHKLVTDMSAADPCHATACAVPVRAYSSTHGPQLWQVREHAA